MNYKQLIIIRQDLKLPKGKAISQGAHAAVEACLKSDKDKVKMWRQNGSKKITLKVQSKTELFKALQLAKDNNIACTLITDAGKTVIAPGTETAVGIGPENEEKLDTYFANYKLL